GVHVSERTVSRLLKPHTRRSPQTWKTFLTNHLACAASMDFFTVPTVTGHVLFVLIVLSHVRRRIVHFNITEHPTAEWTAQQVVDAFPDDTAPKWLHRDRDSVYGESFRRRVAGMGVAEVVSAPASPRQNPYAERVIGSIRRECLDHVIVLNQAHLRRVLTWALTHDQARCERTFATPSSTRRLAATYSPSARCAAPQCCAVFAVAAGAPAQIVSLQKIQGRLADRGALETVAHYLELLQDAYLVAPLEKFAKRGVRK